MHKGSLGIWYIYFWEVNWPMINSHMLMLLSCCYDLLWFAIALVSLVVPIESQYVGYSIHITRLWLELKPNWRSAAIPAVYILLCTHIPPARLCQYCSQFIWCEVKCGFCYGPPICGTLRSSERLLGGEVRRLLLLSLVETQVFCHIFR